MDDQERCADCSKKLDVVTNDERAFLNENKTNRIICQDCGEWLAWAEGRGQRPKSWGSPEHKAAVKRAKMLRACYMGS